MSSVRTKPTNMSSLQAPTYKILYNVHFGLVQRISDFGTVRTFAVRTNVQSTKRRTKINPENSGKENPPASMVHEVTEKM